MKLASVVLLVLISNQNQFQTSRLQDEQNNELKAWVNLESKYTLLAFVLYYSLSLTVHRK